MRIRMLDSVAGVDYSYSNGQEVDVPDHVGSEFIRARVAEEVDPDQIEIAAVEPAERAVKPRGRPRKAVGR